MKRILISVTATALLSACASAPHWGPDKVQAALTCFTGPTLAWTGKPGVTTTYVRLPHGTLGPLRPDVTQVPRYGDFHLDPITADEDEARDLWRYGAKRKQH